MRKRPILITLLTIALAGVLALCGLTAFGAYRYARAQRLVLARNEVAVAESTETVVYNVTTPLEIEIDTELGDIVVEAGGEPGQVTAEITRRGWGETQTEAEEAAGAVQYQVTETPGRLAFKYTAPDPARVIIGVNHFDAVSFTLTVPADTAVVLKTGNGGITLAGTRGDARLENRFGNILVSNLEGGLTVNGTSVTLKGVDAGDAAVEANASFGELSLEDVTAGDITLGNGGGSMRLRRVAASGAVTFTAAFGEVTIEDLSADELTLSNQGGGIKMTGVEIDGTAQVTAMFGDLSLTDVRSGGLTVENNGGGVTIEGVTGAVDVRAAFGEVKITRARDVALTVKTEQGPVTFSGSLDPRAEHSIQTAMGEVTLSLPADSALKLDLDTAMGRIRSDLPVTLSGEMSASTWTGALNDGKSLLTVKTQGGGILIKALEE